MELIPGHHSGGRFIIQMNIEDKRIKVVGVISENKTGACGRHVMLIHHSGIEHKIGGTDEGGFQESIATFVPATLILWKSIRGKAHKEKESIGWVAAGLNLTIPLECRNLMKPNSLSHPLNVHS